MGEVQNGFRSDRRAEDNVFVLNGTIGRMKKDGRRMYVAFLDVEKAYDRVKRDILYSVLERLGMSEKIVSIVRSLYRETRAIYTLGNIRTDWMYSQRGVRQKCVQSPLLFGLYTEELAVRMRSIHAGVNVDEQRLQMLMYADDIAQMNCREC